MAVINKLVRSANDYNNVYFDSESENKINFRELGYVVQSSPNYEFAESEVESVKIPGRSGENVRFTGAYSNITKSYVFIKELSDNEDFRDHKEFYGYANTIVSLLKSKPGYRVLQDSYESDVYRLAYYKDASVVTNGLNQVMTIQVNFECKPQRFLIDGLTPITTGFDNINNPTLFDSNPIIRINKYGNSQTTILTINNVDVLTITWEGASHIIIDSERMDCYDENGNNLNGKVNYISEFPKLNPGKNVVSTNNSTIAYIEPRWWTL